MMDDHGELLGRAIDTLRELPKVRTEATARVLIAVAAERQRQREAAGRDAGHGHRWISWGAGAAAAAVIVTLSWLPAARRDDSTAMLSVKSARPSVVAAIPAAAGGDMANAARPVQFMLSAAGARSVRVVGDFNGWDERQSPMVRDDASGVWSANLMVRPGRHVYAFVVNDTQWVRDPRATRAPDADFGRPGSVLLVGRP